MSSIITQPINDEYEFIQYNFQLRLIHSIKDDLYQMQSIINSCQSDKRAQDWFDNKSTQELLDEMRKGEFSPSQVLYENRQNLPMGLRGYYINRLLVNHVAMWCSPRYSIHIMRLLDNYFEQQRIKLQTQINEQLTQINNLKSRAVPNKREHDYIYFIWKETLTDDDLNVKLHLIRRHKEYFRKIKLHYYNPEERWYYRDNLPISMSINNDIKNIIYENFHTDEASINGNTITINKEILDDLHEMIEQYFNEFQDII